MPLQTIDRDIRRLALPALGALIAEPLFLLTDTALIGHLGAESIAGLAIASTVLQTAIGLLVFLAYATTPAVARRLGAGDERGAVRAGIDGLWLALLVGVLLVLAGLPTARPLVAAFGAPSAVTDVAVTYLTVSLWGIPGMLLVIAATGLLRGLQDTRTPLVVAVVGFAANAALNAVFIYGLGWGVAGSAAGTVVVQWAMAAVYLVIAVRAARRTGARLRPGVSGVRSAATSGGWLLVRTASLRAGMLATVIVGTSLGVSELATLQIALTIYSAIALALDALAIAGQALIGHGLGSGDVDRVRLVTSRLISMGLRYGGVLALAIALVSPVAGIVFTSDAEVRMQLTWVLIVMAVGIPLAGYVFVLDGVLIGAGDAKYLAITGALNLLAYAPMLLLVSLSGLRGPVGLALLWAAFGIGYIGARAVTLGWRARGGRWMVTGDAAASRSR